MTEKTTRALIAYERRMKHMPQAIASVGVDAADPVLLAQKGLQQLGFYSGPTDGALGPGTRDAIIRFEVSRHLPVDPRVSDRLLAALEAAGAEAGTAPPALPGSLPQAAPAAQAQEATSEATGRRQLPPGVNPPPIR